jgi:hypothetical protein
VEKWRAASWPSVGRRWAARASMPELKKAEAAAACLAAASIAMASGTRWGRRRTGPSWGTIDKERNRRAWSAGGCGRRGRGERRGLHRGATAGRGLEPWGVRPSGGGGRGDEAQRGAARRRRGGERGWWRAELLFLLGTLLIRGRKADSGARAKQARDGVAAVREEEEGAGGLEMAHSWGLWKPAAVGVREEKREKIGSGTKLENETLNPN